MLLDDQNLLVCRFTCQFWEIYVEQPGQLIEKCKKKGHNTYTLTFDSKWPTVYVLS